MKNIVTAGEQAQFEQLKRAGFIVAKAEFTGLADPVWQDTYMVARRVTFTAVPKVLLCVASWSELCSATFDWSQPPLSDEERRVVWSEEAAGHFLAKTKLDGARKPYFVSGFLSPDKSFADIELGLMSWTRILHFHRMRRMMSAA